LAIKLAKAGIITSVYGVGTLKGAPVPTQAGLLENAAGKIIMSKRDDKGLQQLAKSGRGNYVTFTSDNSDLDKLLLPVTTFKKKSKAEQTMTLKRWRDDGFWLILLLLPLAALAFRRGWMEQLTE